jgi:GTP cyclohydrolase III
MLGTQASAEQATWVDKMLLAAVERLQTEGGAALKERQERQAREEKEAKVNKFSLFHFDIKA